MLNHSRCPVGFSRLGPPYPSGWVGVLVQKSQPIARQPVRSPSPERDTGVLHIQPLALIPFLHFTPLLLSLQFPSDAYLDPCCCSNRRAVRDEEEHILLRLIFTAGISPPAVVFRSGSSMDMGLLGFLSVVPPRLAARALPFDSPLLITQGQLNHSPTPGSYQKVDSKI